MARAAGPGGLVELRLAEAVQGEALLDQGLGFCGVESGRSRLVTDGLPEIFHARPTPVALARFAK